MPGILPINDAMGSSALSSAENSAILAARNRLYNQQVRGENLAALGQLASDATTAGLKAGQAYSKGARGAQLFGHFFRSFIGADPLLTPEVSLEDDNVINPKVSLGTGEEK